MLFIVTPALHSGQLDNITLRLLTADCPTAARVSSAIHSLTTAWNSHENLVSGQNGSVFVY